MSITAIAVLSIVACILLYTSYRERSTFIGYVTFILAFLLCVSIIIGAFAL